MPNSCKPMQRHVQLAQNTCTPMQNNAKRMQTYPDKGKAMHKQCKANANQCNTMESNATYSKPLQSKITQNSCRQMLTNAKRCRSNENQCKTMPINVRHCAANAKQCGTTSDSSRCFRMPPTCIPYPRCLPDASDASHMLPDSSQTPRGCRSYGARH